MNKLNITGNTFPLTVENLQLLQDQNILLQTILHTIIPISANKLVFIKNNLGNTLAATYQGEFFEIIERTIGSTTYTLVEKNESIITDTQSFNNIRTKRYVVVGTATIGEKTIKTFNSATASSFNINERITTAQTTANTAQTTANTAQTTADTAQTTADTAKSIANTAQTTANTAQTTANQAQVTANDAHDRIACVERLQTYIIRGVPNTSTSHPDNSICGHITFNITNDTLKECFLDFIVYAPNPISYIWISKKSLLNSQMVSFLSDIDLTQNRFGENLKIISNPETDGQFQKIRIYLKCTSTDTAVQDVNIYEEINKLQDVVQLSNCLPISVDF